MDIQRLELESVDWAYLDSFHDRTIFQTRPWLSFVAATQGAEPLIAELREQGEVIGFFTGWMARKYGIRILGSPFPGSSTYYAGFNLLPGVSRVRALKRLLDFAFGELGCLHVEIMDRHLTLEDGIGFDFESRNLSGYEIDLTRDEDQIFGAMDSDRRRCIRKAAQSGVTIEVARDSAFADDYYAQLQDVFAKQGLVPWYPKRRVQALLEHLLPTGNLLLLRVRDPQGKCIAAGIFPAWNDTFYYWGGASWRWGLHLHPNEPMHWYAMQYWKSRGIARYDMGGSGSYKEKYGGRPIAVPCFRKSKYSVLSSCRDNLKKLHQLIQRTRGALDQALGRHRSN